MQLFTHRKQHTCTHIRIHRKMLRIDTILLMWGVAENVKFRVCSSSRFSNGAHARCRCVESNDPRSVFSWKRGLRVEVTVSHLILFIVRYLHRFSRGITDIDIGSKPAKIAIRSRIISRVTCHWTTTCRGVTIQINRKRAGKVPARTIVDSEIGNIDLNREMDNGENYIK